VPATVAPVARKGSSVPIPPRSIGAVQAFQTALLRARVDGTLDQVFFEEGQEVKRGDRLALLDPRPYQAALDQALAKKAQDEAQPRQRAARSRPRPRARPHPVDHPADRRHPRRRRLRVLEAQVRAADDAAIAAARVNLDYTNITAPFDGRVGIRQLDPGNVVRAADTGRRGHRQHLPDPPDRGAVQPAAGPAAGRPAPAWPRAS
jgi:multidrug efflux system membrane fusion protein